MTAGYILETRVVRIGLSLAGAVVVVCLLFALMSTMIRGGAMLPSAERASTMMHFVRVKEVSQVQTRTREQPPPPQPQQQPPPPARPQLASIPAPVTPMLNFEMPALNAPLGLGQGPFIGGIGAPAASGSELLPLVRIEPQYPRQAAMAGLEGWVKVRLDIEADGSVSNVVIVDASPRRVWDRATERALLRWKFRPMEVDGRALRVEGHEVTIDFKLNR